MADDDIAPICPSTTVYCLLACASDMPSRLRLDRCDDATAASKCNNIVGVHERMIACLVDIIITNVMKMMIFD